MPDETESSEAKIARIVAQLRQTFEPLAARLTPEVEPAVFYVLQPVASAPKTNHDDQ